MEATIDTESMPDGTSPDTTGIAAAVAAPC
ncbi:hypothetical protein MAV100_26050 [Mycobacterium avium subsp. hominissuis 100]|nr:hypothetical protein MAV100_26050 [Mycobacterium avium subsp. hominissuis 100]